MLRFEIKCHRRVDTVVMNPPFGTKHNKGLDMKFLQVEGHSLAYICILYLNACALRLAWKWHQELCIRFTKAQPETMSCPRQKNGGQKEGTSDLLFCKMLEVICSNFDPQSVAGSLQS